jgi:LmeA-like phospholipid-binding
MEILSIVLAGLLTLVSPVGLVVDKTAEKAFTSQFSKVEAVKIRIDSVPNYQILQGKIDKIQIAAKGVWITPEIRIALLELETDPLTFDLQKLKTGQGQSLMQAFQKSPQAGLKLVLTETDINNSLKSSLIQDKIKKLLVSFGSGSASFLENYDLQSMQIKFLPNQRVSINTELQQIKNQKKLNLNLETGILLQGGRKIQLKETTITLDGKPIPPLLVNGLLGKINDKLDLNRLEEKGLLTRVLQWKVEGDRLEIVTFIQGQKTN